MSVATQPVPGSESRTVAPPLSVLPPSAAGAPIRIFIAYDDIAVGRQAIDWAVHLAGGSDGNVEWPPRFRHFDVLTNAANRQAATDDGGAANVIVIGLSQAESMDGIDGWLEQVVGRRGEGAVSVVALVSKSLVPSPRLEARLAALAEIARHGEAGFFVNEAGHAPTGTSPVDAATMR